VVSYIHPYKPQEIPQLTTDHVEMPQFDYINSKGHINLEDGKTGVVIISTVRGIKYEWRMVAILVGCSPHLQLASSLAVVVIAYHKPFEHLNRLAVDHNNQTTRSIHARTSTASGTNKN